MTDNSETVKAINTAFEIGQTAGKTFMGPDGRAVILVPNGYRPHEMMPVDTPEKELRRVKGGAVVHDSASFIAYVNRFKTSTTRIFAEPGFLALGGKATVHAIIDYHNINVPEHCAHTVTYAPRYANEWEKWTKASGFEQVAFAEFIEENRNDIREPAAASLIDVVQTFKASRKVEFDSVVRQQDGSIRLGYSDQVDAKGQSSALPEKMQLGIPVYFRGQPYAVDVWVRYKVGTGKVTFMLKMDRPDVIEDEAFRQIIADIGKGTEIEPYTGRAIIKT